MEIMVKKIYLIGEVHSKTLMVWATIKNRELPKIIEDFRFIGRLKGKKSNMIYKLIQKEDIKRIFVEHENIEKAVEDYNLYSFPLENIYSLNKGYNDEGFSELALVASLVGWKDWLDELIKEDMPKREKYWVEVINKHYAFPSLVLCRAMYLQQGNLLQLLEKEDYDSKVVYLEKVPELFWQPKKSKLHI